MATARHNIEKLRPSLPPCKLWPPVRRRTGPRKPRAPCIHQCSLPTCSGTASRNLPCTRRPRLAATPTTMKRDKAIAHHTRLETTPCRPRPSWRNPSDERTALRKQRVPNTRPNLRDANRPDTAPRNPRRNRQDEQTRCRKISLCPFSRARQGRRNATCRRKGRRTTQGRRTRHRHHGPTNQKGKAHCNRERGRLRLRENRVRRARVT